MKIIIAGKAGLYSGAKRAPEIAPETGRILARTSFVEDAGPIKPRMLYGTKTIGISGGASTPPESIEAAVAKIQRNFEQHHHEESRPQ